jgi:hypothetical protein
MTDWVSKAGQFKIAAKAQAIWDVNDQATDRLDVTDGRVLQMILLEVINQCQNGQGFISAPELNLIADCLGKEHNCN